MQDSKRTTKYKPLVYICSPYSGNVEANTEKARQYCRMAVDMGVIPIAPHLYFPQFMSEETERDTAMLFNKVILSRCTQVWVFGDEVTRGMLQEIAYADRHGKTVRYFMEDGKEI